MRTPSFTTVLAVLFGAALLATACGQGTFDGETAPPIALEPDQAPGQGQVQSPAPLELVPVELRATADVTFGTLVVLPTIPEGLSGDLGVVVSSGVDPVGDRPPPPDFQR